MKSFLFVITLFTVLGAIAITVLAFESMGANAILPVVMVYALFLMCLAVAWSDEVGQSLWQDIRSALQDWSNAQAMQ